MDHIVRVFNISMKEGGVPLLFKGHSGKVFNLEWNQVLCNYLASASDDKTIRIWNLQNVNDSKDLVGHENNVRGLVWSTEIPWLLISGSWDCTIRLWDVRTQKCLFVCRDHNADVYGLAIHEERPFLCVSCSRDTSLRFWELEGIFKETFLKVLIQNDWEEVFGRPEAIFPKPNEKVMLYGGASQKMRKEILEMRNDGNWLGVYERVMKFFKVIRKNGLFLMILL